MSHQVFPFEFLSVKLVVLITCLLILYLLSLPLISFTTVPLLLQILIIQSSFIGCRKQVQVFQNKKDREGLNSAFPPVNLDHLYKYHIKLSLFIV